MNPAASPLLTDLYQLTMLEAYLAEGMAGEAVFELFVRKLPPQRNFLVAAGLEPLLLWLRDVRLGDDDLAWLESQKRFSPALIDYLRDFRFSGAVDAMPEGTVFFPDEPIVRVTAPIGEAQLIETRLINLIQFQTVVASKAARCMLAAQGRELVDFGLRRAYGAEAGLLAARAAYAVGFAGTSAVAAGQAFGIPIFGTMAHSYVQAHAREIDAFDRYAGVHPHGVTLLIDTYDTEAAAHKVVELAPRLRARGAILAAVRIDSGDHLAHAQRVRDILDRGGLDEVEILASGGIDEHDVERLLAGGAPIDAFGIGTALATSTDAPALDCAYKLEVYAGQPRRKRSEGKATWPGAKQVYRRRGADGVMAGDTIALLDERVDGEALLQPVLRAGSRVAPAESLQSIRSRCARELAQLPRTLRQLRAPASYPVQVSPAVSRLADALDREAH